MSSRIEVEIVISTSPRTVQQQLFQIHCDSQLSHLLNSAEVQNFLDLHGLKLHELKASCWGQKISNHQNLSNGDRIELCRELRVDPKVARRERFEKQGKRGAGLFSLAGKKKTTNSSLLEGL